MANPFETQFKTYACEGDTISCHVDGFELVATVYRDDNTEDPTERSEGFWPSLDPASAGYIGPKSKATLARRTAKAQRVLDAYHNDEWFYCGVAVTVSRNGVRLTKKFDNTLWDIECN